ncbi:conserved hypothetical protein [Leishmania major strain Friedlin]|uniref:Mut7-C RNAse domain-containing protein n=1 Tax=Leishmania major TaxID=5664 RepID=Q4Q5L2_LEIMA|nr:conserved hypothetical protein [Leishmania major strain Friedlin]CAG9580063.1 Mut7-C_RNAse_domain_containing_protein_-_putative [Leishmania major strain Friedlin]CAJ08569.1 conserved hypothetical protein [Leishmania major strain Friedlin]|eukprot:XP_001685386.1 conserved hypothetical protein [Leishmania major strain Friedlin]
MPCNVSCSTSPNSVTGEPRFIMDFSMNKVAKYFRLLGYDTLCSRDVPQANLIPTACAEGRILVTCSRPLARSVQLHNQRVRTMRLGIAKAMTGAAHHVIAYDSDGESIYSEDSEEVDVELRCLFTQQWCSGEFKRAMIELIQQAGVTYDLNRVFRRCVTCNELLVTMEKEEVRGRVVAKIYEIYDEFTECPTCRKVFWGFDGVFAINYKSFRSLNLLRSLCICAGAPVEEERTRLNRLRCFRSFPRIAKVLIFSYLEDVDLANMTVVFPALRDLAEEVQASRQTGEPVRKMQLRKH